MAVPSCPVLLLTTCEKPGLGGRVIPLPQGRLLGGSSGLNGQTLVAPSQTGIDAWAKIGNKGWDWESLRGYYRKFYTLNLPDDEIKKHLGLTWVDENVRGESGPIQVSFTGSMDNPMPKAWNETFQKLGLDTSADPFTGNSIGAYANMQTVDPKTKTRSYSANAYAAPAMSRQNFKIIYGAEVQRIVLDKPASSEEEATATGVEYLSGEGQVQFIKAQQEVIVASGVFQSPKLLELSGIGGKDILSKHGIETIVDNPNVGERMQDHLMTGISFEVVDGIPTADPLVRREPAALKAAQEAYATTKSGPLTVGGIGSHAYLPLQDASNPSLKNQFQTDFLAKLETSSNPHEQAVRDILQKGDDGSGALFLFQAQGVTHENEATAEHGPVLQDGNFFSFGCIQTHPLSTGSSHISSKDASAKPAIDPKYFSNPLDIELMARHLLFCLEVQKREPLSNYFVPNGRRNHAKAFIQDIDDAKQYLRDTAKTTYHCCGTCSMRPKDQGGVVDDQLRVYGTKNLRVVDASIFPFIPRGNIMSTVYAVAEKAADLIKASWAVFDSYDRDDM